MVRFFLIPVVFLVVLSCGMGSALGQSNGSKDEAIKELLKVMNTVENMKTSLETMKDTIKMNSPYFLKEMKVILARDLEEKDVDKAAKAFLHEEFGVSRLYELFRYKFNLERVQKEIMIPVYQEHYSEAEIKDLIVFYTSELGQKTLKLSPIISREISSKTRDISQLALSQAKDELAFELIKDLKKE